MDSDISTFLPSALLPVTGERADVRPRVYAPDLLRGGTPRTKGLSSRGFAPRTCRDSQSVLRLRPTFALPRSPRPGSPGPAPSTGPQTRPAPSAPLRPRPLNPAPRHAPPPQSGPRPAPSARPRPLSPAPSRPAPPPQPGPRPAPPPQPASSRANRGSPGAARPLHAPSPLPSSPRAIPAPSAAFRGGSRDSSRKWYRLHGDEASTARRSETRANLQLGRPSATAFQMIRLRGPQAGKRRRGNCGSPSPGPRGQPDSSLTSDHPGPAPGSANFCTPSRFGLCGPTAARRHARR